MLKINYLRFLRSQQRPTFHVFLNQIRFMIKLHVVVSGIRVQERLFTKSAIVDFHTHVLFQKMSSHAFAIVKSMNTSSEITLLS